MVKQMVIYYYITPVMFTDSTGFAPEWLKTILIVAAVIVVVTVVTIATAGIGTAVAGALGGGAAATIIGGAVGGAITGGITGAVIGGGYSIVSQGISNGYDNINWSQVGKDSLTGAITGAVTGAVLGAISGAIKVGQAARMWDKGTFKSGFQSMKYHYAKHGKQIGSIINYTDEAVGFGFRNASSMTLNSSYSGLQNYWTWTCKVGSNGYFTSAGKIITFWI